MENNLNKAYDKKGEAISPVLAAGTKNYLIDIDGTITDDIPNEEPERMKTCKPFADAIETMSKWYDEGHTIFFFTSRTEALREITETWLKENNIRYHGIIFGKGD